MSTTSTGPDPAVTAEGYFIDFVYPQLENDCAPCHATSAAPTFFATTDAGTYNAMDAYGGLIVAPQNSNLLLHGAHTGPALSPQEKIDVTQWLTLEAQERGLDLGDGGGGVGGSGGTSTGMTLQQALADYGACMDLVEWKSYGLDKLPSQQTTNGGPCYSCHSAGDGGSFLSLNVDETFDKNSVFPYIKRQVTGTVDQDGNFDKLIPSNRWSQKGSEPCQPNTNCHPKFALPPDIKNGIDAFVNSTLNKMSNKLCGSQMP